MAVLGVLLSLNAMAYDAYVNGIYYNLDSYSLTAAVTYNKFNSGEYSGKVSIPSSVSYNGNVYSVTSINYAFHGCSGLTSINIPSSVTTIGPASFYGCSNLTSITIPNSVTSIGSSTFEDCSGLTSITIPNSVMSIYNHAFAGCKSLTSITIPNSVMSIYNHAFAGCKSLTSITLPNNVTSLEDYTFSGCSGLTSVTIPNSVTSIGCSAFYGCSGLTAVHITDLASWCNISFKDFDSNPLNYAHHLYMNGEEVKDLVIPISVTNIGNGAFSGCSGLTSITIPNNSVTSIGNGAFEYCYNLKDIYCFADETPSVGSFVFESVDKSQCTLHVPNTSLEAYSTTAPWKEFGTIVGMDVEDATNVEITEGADEFKNYQERTCNSLTYTRTFNNTNWQALYVPFSLTYEDWKEDFEVARINAFYEYDTDDDGVVDEVDLEIFKVQEGNGDLRPDYPYLIKAKETGEKTLTLTGATLYVTEENSIDCATVDTKYTFTGTYQKVNGMKTAGYYFMSGGSLKTASNDEVALGAFRWYMKAESRGSAFLERPVNINIRVVGEVDANEATSIEGLESEGDKADSKRVYGMDGRLVSTNGLQGLKAGIYLMNGKKIWIR